MVSEEVQKMGHLMRRAGFGASLAELQQRSTAGMENTIHELMDTRIPAQEDDAADAMIQSMMRRDREGKLRPQMLQPWWIYRMTTTKSPLLEKMTLFWHGHFATSANKAYPTETMLQQNRFFRENALGNWRAMLKGISRDPAMIVWLDNNQNFQSHPNENYGRELMELFSLGIGHYSEDDVKQAARAFTGWSQNNGNFIFNARQHDTGLKTFLGRTGNFDGDDIIDIILEQPAAAEFLTRKLFTYFAYAHPEPDIVTELASKFRQADYDLGILVGSIFRSEAFWSKKAINSQIKSPVQLVVGTLRALGLGQEAPPAADGDMMMMPTKSLGIFTFASQATKQMGQDLFFPPNVKGWDGGPAWVNSATMMARVNFASRAAATAGAGGLHSTGIQLISSSGADSADSIVDNMLANLGPLELPVASRAALIKSIDGQDVPATGKNRRFQPRYQQLARIRIALGLVLQSPQYQIC